MSNHRLHKQKRARRIEMMIQAEIAKAEKILDENAVAMRALSRQLYNEPRALKQAFATIEKLGSESGKENA